MHEQNNFLLISTNKDCRLAVNDNKYELIIFVLKLTCSLHYGMLSDYSISYCKYVNAGNESWVVVHLKEGKQEKESNHRNTERAKLLTK